MAAAAYARALLDDIASHGMEFGKRQSEVLKAVHIGLFTWLVLVIDDFNLEMGLDLQNFQSRFARGDTQPSAILDCFAGVLRSTANYYDHVMANFIVISALASVNAHAVEIRHEYQAIALTKDTVSWPYYVRDKEGLAEA
ncbi:hypothetical protein PspLS_07113 [Pyricularia sp. CBS 133598]|nr:hypothetical protein PspLS_07113 [Pyricularia sp. CBS 133598]